jgi:hypothetical protein
MSFELLNSIDIEESDYESLKSVGKNDLLSLLNCQDKEFDENELYNYLKNLKGADELENLSIDWNSHLKNVEIVKAFPNLRRLNVYGKNITTLDGLEWFKRSEFLTIETEKNRKRNIEKIVDVPIKEISLEYSQRAKDFDVIAKCRHLKYLAISKSPSPNFNEWGDVPLESLKLLQGSFNELSDIVNLKMMDELYIAGCRKFVRFSGDNSTVKSLTIDCCKLFELNSLKTLPNVEYVLLVACANEIDLSDLPELPKIRWLNIQTSKINADVYELEKKMPNLEKATFQKKTKEQESLFIKANPNIDFTKQWI